MALELLRLLPREMGIVLAILMRRIENGIPYSIY